MKTTKTTALTAAFALALTLGLGACSDDDADTPTQPAVQETTDDQATDEQTTDDGVDATGDDAGATATDEAGAGTGSGDTADITAQALDAIAAAEEASGGVAYEIDDQEDDGSWEVDVAVDDRSVEVTVDANGTVVRTDDDDLDDDDRAGLAAATITLTEAIELAVAEVGGHLDDAELEEDDGQHYWEVSVDGTDQGDDIEVKVSVTGQILGIDN